ncbi:MAG: 16S rRNA (guanine(966)-N(2))-methyltransferase RsmD [Lachnospiraceae bacterium]|nr:16S rRNA (guanine(966)-N(2))-methyltransferase RsmD [Lachnospiraceae bacterium]
MRIIAGSARSLPLKTVPGMEVRPTSDRIKETLFNILNPELPGCRFLDLFAGSGQMGLEAVSRGAEAAVFVENSRKAAACIEDNIKFTKFTDRCTLLVKDAVSAIRWMNGKETFGLVFLDPPYGKKLETEVLLALSESSLLEEEALIVAETALDTDLSQTEELGYRIIREKTYKTNKHIFLRFETGDGGNK